MGMQPEAAHYLADGEGVRREMEKDWSGHGVLLGRVMGNG